jgi:hypothetical protein
MGLRKNLKVVESNVDGEGAGKETYCFASSIMADDKGQGLVEFYNDLIFGAKRPNAFDEHLQGAWGKKYSRFRSWPKISDPLAEHLTMEGGSAYLVYTTHDDFALRWKSLRRV